MVTLITEQLRKQSLDDSGQRSSPFHTNVSFPQVGSSPTVSWSPRQTTQDAKLLTNPSSKPPNVSCGHDSLWTSYHFGEPIQKPEVSLAPDAIQSSPPPPPPKRQCRSLSVPEDLSRCRSTWHPSAFKIWTPVRSRCQSGSTSSSVSVASSFPHCWPRSSLNSISQNSSSSPTFCSLAFSTDSPLPWDNCDALNRGCSTSLATPSTCSSSPAPTTSRSAPQRRFSLSPLHMQSMGFMSHQTSLKVSSSSGAEPHALSPSPSSACSTPSSSRRGLHPALPRCHSQPCDLRKPRLKRRRDSECLPVARPVLNFSKMKQIGCGETLHSTGEFVMPMWPRAEERSPFSPADFFGRASIGPLSESEAEEEEDHREEAKRTLADEGPRVFQRDCSELDLNLIEEN